MSIDNDEKKVDDVVEKGDVVNKEINSKINSETDSKANYLEQNNKSNSDTAKEDLKEEVKEDVKEESKAKLKEKSKAKLKEKSKEKSKKDLDKDKKNKNKKSNNDKEKTDDSKIDMKFIVREFFNWVLTLLACIVIAKAINGFIIVNARVPSASMENTIMTNDRLVANRLAYVFDEPERGDILVFEAPDEVDKLFIKRVIGIPGDKVEIIDGYLYLNDELTDEPYIREPMVGNFGPYYVPEDNYFMLGDNRNNSLDARYWRNTYVPKDTILGKAMFTYYPEIRVIE